jgi:hypothetical protein
LTCPINSAQKLSADSICSWASPLVTRPAARSAANCLAKDSGVASVTTVNCDWTTT